MRSGKDGGGQLARQALEVAGLGHDLDRDAVPGGGKVTDGAGHVQLARDVLDDPEDVGVPHVTTSGRQ